MIGDDVDVALGPAQPDLTMKGRTASSLLRQVARWRKERDDRSNSPARVLLTWDRSSFGEYTQVDEDDTTWTIRELLDSAALVDKARSMEHCVATYAGQCLRRATTIWSLGIEGAEGRLRVLTIEVNPATREIRQAKMARNAEPDERSRMHLARWAEQQGLAFEVAVS